MRILQRVLTREVLTFLGVGGAGYVVDVLVFTWLLSTPPFSSWDPSVSRTVALVAAMVVTFVGNSALTWRGSRPGRREVALFVLLNVVGLGFSVASLTISHDLLGLTSRLDDNVSANGVGLALGTLFRFLTYRLLVFRTAPPTSVGSDVVQSGDVQVDRATVGP